MIHNLTVWGRVTASRLSRLMNVLTKSWEQSHKNWRASATPLYVSLGLLDSRNIFKYDIGNCICKLLRHVNQFNTLTNTAVTCNTRASEQRYLEASLALSTDSEQSLLIAGLLLTMLFLLQCICASLMTHLSSIIKKYLWSFNELEWG